MFWDAAQGKWSTEGVETSKINILENGEFKSYGLACSSKHLSSFAVIADVEVQVSGDRLFPSLSSHFYSFTLSLSLSSLSLSLSHLSLSLSLSLSLISLSV